jgi:ZIP family zinc transporter
MSLDWARSPVSFRSISASLRPCFLGKVLPRTWEGGLIGVANGVLVYLFFDLMHEATEQTGARDVVSWVVFLGSLGMSFVGLVALESSQVFGGRSGSRILSLPYMIAVGMGLHNLGEGLAIGASYASGEYTLSALLVAGFGLHNGTEGFGIVGASGKTRCRGAMSCCWD